MFRASILMMVFLAGCAAESTSTTQPIHASAQGHAECLVCKHNADLACVDLAVTDQTPSTTYIGNWPSRKGGVELSIRAVKPVQNLKGLL